jgi:hypothetical protein
MPFGVRLRILREAKNISLTGFEGLGRANGLAIPASQLICDKSVCVRPANRSKSLSPGEIAWRRFPGRLSLAFPIQRFLFRIRGIHRNSLFLWQTNRFHRSVEPKNRRMGTRRSSYARFKPKGSPHLANIFLPACGGRSARIKHASRDIRERFLLPAKKI